MGKPKTIDRKSGAAVLVQRVVSCVICEEPLKESPTSRYWHKLPRGRGICYDCIFRYARTSLHGLEHEVQEKLDAANAELSGVAASRPQRKD